MDKVRYFFVVFLIFCWDIGIPVADGVTDGVSESSLNGNKPVCGVVYNAPNGTIMSPNYPRNYESHARCEWQISVPDGYVVLVQFTDMDVQYSYNCIRDFLQIRDVNKDGINLAGKQLCGNNLPEPILATGNSIWAMFVSDESVQNNKGFHAEWSAVPMPCNPGWKPSKFDAGVIKTCVKAFKFKMTEHDYPYNVAVRECRAIRAHLLTITTGQQEDKLIHFLEIFARYLIGLRRFAPGDWRWITGEPYEYTRLETEILTESDCVCISVSYANVFAGIRILYWNRVSCKSASLVSGYICEHDLSDDEQCGGTYRTSSGTISSVNYLSIYNGNERCEWNIALSRDKVILLIFTHLNITLTPPCTSDYVKISERMETKQRLLGLFCGYERPAPLGTTGNSAWIEFRASRTSMGRGFELQWTSNSCTYNCDTQLQEEDNANSYCQLICEEQNTLSSTSYVCQQRCDDDFDHSVCELESLADQPCCTRTQCYFNVSVSEDEVTGTVSSDLLADHETHGVNIVLPVAIPALALIGIACIILVWNCRRRRMREVRKESKTSCCCVATSSSRRHHTHYNDVLALSPILKTILEDEVQLKLQPLLMNEDLVELGEQLGRGAFGIVFKGTYTPHGNDHHVQTVAIKTLSDNCIGSEISAFVDEAITMAEFSHIHVLSVIGVCINRKTEVPMIVLPFMEHGDLKTYLRQSRQNQSEVGPPDEMQLLLFCLHIARGMTYLSGLKFIHRDLAARNCMLASNMVVKVADFGLSRDVYSQSYYRQEHQNMLPIRWMSLESLVDHVYTLYADIWSYGVTAWEVMSLGRVPYSELDNSRVLEYLETGARLPRPKTCSDFMYTLMMKCWKEIPEDRLTFLQISKQISDYLAEKCDYLDLSLETDTKLSSESNVTSNEETSCSTVVMADYVDRVEPQISNN